MAKFEPVQFQVVVEFSTQDRERLDGLMERISDLIKLHEDSEVTDLAKRIQDWPVRYEDTIAHVDPAELGELETPR